MMKSKRLGVYDKYHKDGGMLHSNSKALFQPSFYELYDQCYDFDQLFTAFMLPRLRFFRHHRTGIGSCCLSADERTEMHFSKNSERRKYLHKKAQNTYDDLLDKIINIFERYMNAKLYDRELSNEMNWARQECMKLMESFWL
jgi:hypothetical protein